MNRRSCCAFILILGVSMLSENTFASDGSRLPDSLPPAMACWFWHSEEFAPEGYKPFLDMMGEHSHYNLLTTSLRVAELELSDESVFQQIKAAAEYAKGKGIGLVFDLDLRLDRQHYREKHPDDLQQMLCLREVKPSLARQISIKSQDLSDHYTGSAIHYIPLHGQFLKACVYRKGAQGIIADSIRWLDSEDYKIEKESEQEVALSFPDRYLEDETICVMAAFTHLYPDPFSQSVIDWQHALLEKYAHIGLRGACKDEWGFPPCFDGSPSKEDYWHSPRQAEAYASRAGGREFIEDALLMTYGIEGREKERQMAINHFNEIVRDRHSALEKDFYDAVKKYFGPDAVVATHPTWYPYPGVQEFKKNGLDWWSSPRDYAQTDEITPYCARTSLAKRWNSPLWYNMYYSPKLEDYWREVWADALTGGRLNLHPPYPRTDISTFDATRMVLASGYIRADCRARLLNYITHAPLDCRTALVFGDMAAMNWAAPAVADASGQEGIKPYADVGMGLCDALWQAGYACDLIPLSESLTGALRIGKEGQVEYGSHSYDTVILHRVDYLKKGQIDFIQAAVKSKSALLFVGTPAHDFEAGQLGMSFSLPAKAQVFAPGPGSHEPIISTLRGQGMARQEFTVSIKDGFGYQVAVPDLSGMSSLSDGTRILISARENMEGDPMRRELNLDGKKIRLEAVGLAAFRFAKDGSLEALAAGGLTRFECEGFNIRLDAPLDLALWKDKTGTFNGVFQGYSDHLPKPLAAIAKHWDFLCLPSVVDNK